MEKKLIIMIVTISITAVIVCVTGFVLIPELSGNPSVRNVKALLADYDIPGAFASAEKGIGLFPDNVSLRLFLLKTVNISFYCAYPFYYGFSNHPLVIETVERFGKGTHAELVSETGHYFWIKNEKDRAIPYFEKAVELDPGYYQPYNFLGNYYYETDLARAVQYYEKLFALKPESLDFLGISIIDEYIDNRIIGNTGVKRLFLNDPSPRILDNLSLFKRLEFLQLTGPSVTDGYSGYIRKSPHLKALCLRLNSISRIEQLDGLDDLLFLAINDNTLDKIENIGLLGNLKVLDLRGNRISAIAGPESPPHIERLYLSHNMITKIENLEGLAGLRHLDLYDNLIQRIENLDRLPDLEILNLYFNRITTIENLDSSGNLKHLYLRGNSISKLENLDGLSGLETLDLYGNLIETIENLEGLTGLTILNLCKNKIERIEHLDTLVNLRELDLRMNRIDAIRNLERLTNLRSLSLSYNGIRKIENLDALRNLETLYMSVTEIERIENLERLTNLKHLFLGGAHIKKIENLDTLTRLQTLYMSGNEISRLENLSALTNLTSLNLGTNLIEKIENIGTLSHLETLDLYENRIAILGNVDGLTGLRRLYLGNNRFGTGDETVLQIPASLRNLKALAIGGPGYMEPGHIRDLRGLEYLEAIEELEFSYQDLSKLPDISTLKKLTKLHLEKHTHLAPLDFKRFPPSITSMILWNVNLTDLDGIGHCENLRTLWVGDNPRLESIAGVNDLKHLEELNIGLCNNLPESELLNLLSVDTLMTALDQYPPRIIEALQMKGITVKMY
ncbi:MAG: leucine-rich repeat protein [Spirochaetales bacterium]|nr:leucine-rich repeat protein [Spirochaetales bacterium]